MKLAIKDIGRLSEQTHVGMTGKRYLVIDFKMLFVYGPFIHNIIGQDLHTVFVINI